MTNLMDHEKMGKTALSLTAYLRILREDIAWMHDKLLARNGDELTSLEIVALSNILDKLEEDISKVQELLKEKRNS